MKNKLMSALMLATLVLTNLPIGQTILFASEIKSLSIDALASADLTEEYSYSDEQLKAIYGVTTNASVGSEITVDASQVNYDVPGDYQITFSVTDSVSGETASTIASATVIDKLPIVTLDIPNIAYKIGTSPNYIRDYQPQANEVYSDDLTDQIVVNDSEVVYDRVGSYNVYFEATDEEGNVGSATGTVTFTNDTPTVTSKPEATIDEESILTNQDLVDLFMVEATDEDEIESINVDDSLVDYSKPGSYSVIMTATDIWGATSPVHYGILNITDLLPTIELASDVVTVGSYSTPDYLSLFNPIGTEITEGDLTAQITMDSSSVDTSYPGSYPVYFEVTDEEGNVGEAEGTVIVEYSNPTITSDPEAYIYEEEIQTDEDLLTMFNVATTNMGSATIEVDQSAINYSTPADYQVVFTITDEFGTEVTSTSILHILDKAPKITFRTEYIIAHVGDKINYKNYYGASATEFVEGDLDDTMVIDSSAVKIDEVGTYPVYFSATDSDGTTITEEVTLSLKNEVPVVKTNEEVTIDEGTEYSDEDLIELFNITASDVDGIKSINIDSHSVDYDVPGDYDVYVTASDIYNATSEPQHMILHINDVVPTMTIQNRIAFSHITDPVDYHQLFKYQATEFETGDLTEEVIIDDSAVNYDEVGPYDVIFTVSDNDGNTLTEKHQIVITDDSPEIASNSYAVSPEGLNLSEQDLLHLFNVTITDQDGIKNVRVDTSDIDFNKPDLYYVGFIAQDAYGKDSTKYYAKLLITDKQPDLILTTEDVEAHIGTEPDYSVLFEPIASELATGDLTSIISTDSSAVDYNTVGTYPVTFSVMDDEENLVEAIGNITITNDNPVITSIDSISGDEESVISEMQYLTDLAVTTTDIDTITSTSVDDSQVNYSKPGTYTIEITATDQYNASSTKSAEVVINDLLPTLSTSTNSVTAEIGSDVNYLEQYGLVATEITEGDLSAKIKIDDSQVDYQSVGTYPVTATVSDQESNVATQQLNLTLEQPVSDDDTSDEKNTISPIVDSDDQSDDSSNLNDDSEAGAQQLTTTGSKLLFYAIIILIIASITKFVLRIQK